VKRLVLALVAVAFALGLLQSASAHTSCWIGYSGSYKTYDSDDHDNTCGDNSNISEYFTMNGGSDTVNGGGFDGAPDAMRGGPGNDYLTDALYGSDNDSGCDGAGSDRVAFRDADGRDHWYRVEGDSATDEYSSDSGDGYSSHASCPI